MSLPRADESGLTYLCVVMNAYSDDENNMACTDAKNLLEMCLNNFSYTGVLSEKSIICEIPVRLAVNTDYVTLLPGAELKALLPTDLDYASEITVEPRVSDDYASAPGYEGEVYGEAVVKNTGTKRYLDLFRLLRVKTLIRATFYTFWTGLKILLPAGGSGFLPYLP